MKRELTAILACPLCKGQLDLKVEAEGSGEIVSGILYCPRCSAAYPIRDGIPNLLPPQREI